MTATLTTTTAATIGACVGGYRGCQGTGILMPNPYILEIDNQVVLQVLCAHCATQSSQDT